MIPPAVKTVGPVNVGDTTVKLDTVAGLAPGQYITIGGGAVVYRIVKVTPSDLTIDIAPGALASLPAEKAIAFSPAKFATFGSVRGTVTVDVTDPVALAALAAEASYYETIKLIGSLAGPTTFLAPSEDGWSARFLDLTTRNGYALSVNTAPPTGMADYPLTNGKTQRLYVEYDASVAAYNIRPEGPPA